MADEAVCIETPTRFRRYTVANGTGIPIGTLLRLTSPNTAIATSAADQAFAGIAWEEKTANDGIVEIVAALNGIWELRDAGAGFNAGAIICTGGTNRAKVAAAARLLDGSVIGKALATAGANAWVRVAVGESV